MKAINKTAVAMLIMTQLTSAISFAVVDAATRTREAKSKIEKEMESGAGKDIVSNFESSMKTNKSSKALEAVLSSFKDLMTKDSKIVNESIGSIRESEIQAVANAHIEVDGKQVSVVDLMKTILQKNEAIKSLLKDTSLTENQKRDMYIKQLMLAEALKNLTLTSQSNRMIPAVFKLANTNEKKQGLLAFEKAISVIINKVESMSAEESKSYHKVLKLMNQKMNGGTMADEAFTAAVKEIYKEDGAQKLKDLIDCV